MKSFSKRVASFAMAAAMVCSLAVVSPVDAEAAAKPKFEKTRTAITAGTNYTYAVKNVTSKQYVKVYASTGIAVKYNNAKVTKGKTEIKGGKTIKLKINANNKVANYKGKVTVKVFNKKTDKKVKDLSDSFTVKCAKLAINSVEPATMVDGMTGNGHKYIVVNFNKTLSSLEPSEVAIREKNTNRLLTVEKVALAADKKSATLTLLGDNSTSQETFVNANTDYVLTVTKSNATASMDFNFQAVHPNMSVIATDAAKSTITTGAGTYTVPTTITVDFEDILGRTVTYWFDNEYKITKLVVANETPVYGAFNVVTPNSANTDELEFVSKVDSNEKYKNLLASSGSIKRTTSVGNGEVATSTNNSFDYVKIIRNTNGTIKTYQAYKMTNVILVDSVSGTILRQSKTTSANLDKYTIVKDGKTITVDQILKGDVVIYDKNKKFAEVYNNTVTGVITSVSATKVVIDGKAYEYKDDNSANKYIKDDLDKNLTEKVFAGFMASKEPVTLCFNRAGKLIFAKGTEAAVATNTTEYVLTKNAGNFGSANKHYLSLTASNGTDKLTDIALDNLKFVYYDSVFTKQCDDEFKGDAISTAGVDVVSFNGAWTTNTTIGDGILAASSNDLSKADTICTIGAITAFSVVSITKDSKTNEVKTIKVEKTPETTVSSNEVFKGGLGKIAVQKDSSSGHKEFKISSSTPVYEVGKDNVVTKTEYSAFTKVTDKAKCANVYVYLNKEWAKADSVTRIVINNNGTNVYGLAKDKDVTGVVTAFDTSNIDGKHLVSLSVMGVDGTVVDFTTFENKSDSTNVNAIAVGKLVKVEYATVDNKNVATSVATATSEISETTGVSGNTVSDNKVIISSRVYSLTEDAKIVVLANDAKSVKTISYAELMTMTDEKDFIGMYANKYSEGYVNFVIVREDLRKTVY